MKGIIKKALIGFSFMSLVSVANATPVTWTLDSTQTTLSFIQVSGTFTYDADTDSYSNAVFRFSRFAQDFGINSGSNADSLSFGIAGNSGIYTLVFDTPLSNAGGIVTGTGSSSGNTWSFSIHSPVISTPVSEPESAALVLAGLSLIGFAARRKSV